MFTGIIEALGRIERIDQEKSNRHITISSPISAELKIDQSVAHNGVCLTVTDLGQDRHTVTAVEETLRVTTLEDWSVGDVVDLERAMKLGDRLDGHLVQGHVDTIAEVVTHEETGGSWHFRFSHATDLPHKLIEKGSVCIDGISLTCFDVAEDAFSVAIIPYTYEHTVLRHREIGDRVNIEFDMIGKYVGRYFSK